MKTSGEGSGGVPERIGVPRRTDDPERIGPYDVLEVLGRGGMGVVYVARDPRLERRVAIKVLSEELSRNIEWNARFTLEARLLASLNHPNIATIHSLERDGDLEFLTMELIPGRSLDELIRSGVLTLPDALSIGRQIARALEAAHGAGVIHRDLKPLNVMVTPESHVKVLDFGLATRGSSEGTPPASESRRPPGEDIRAMGDDPLPASDAPGATTPVSNAVPLAAGSGETMESGSGSGLRRVSATTGAGTPGYMSPEQIRGEELDSRTDVWAFGCVLYECLSGTRAFRGATSRERMLSTFRGAPDLRRLPPRTPESIRELIRSCLQLNRDARLRNVSEARELLETALTQRSWEPTPSQAGDTPSRAARQSEVPHVLPSEVSPLIGRAREVLQVRELLDQARLVTLTGVGGGGKTRLAIRIGQQSLGQFPDGVWMVELAPVVESADVVRAVAKTLGVTESAGRTLTESIAANVSTRSLLLILDNCEHVVEASAELAGTLLASSPGLKILATSREILGVPGESVFQVPPLQVAAAGSLPFEVLASTEAIQLFAQRAAQVRSDFTVRPENIEEIAEICRRLEGIPLAIELAAARTKVLPLDEIARRLDDRFRLLKGSSRSAVPHHQTLEALIDWSHSHLTENEQKLFRRLSLFRGGWTLDAAEAIGADSDLEAWEILDVLTRLIDKSLVVFTAASGSDTTKAPGSAPLREPRYRMLETVREYAHARWRESKDVESVESHFQSYFVTFVKTAGPHLMDASQPEWLGKIDAEIDNLRAAIARSLDAKDPEPALRLTGQMLRYWMIRGQFREGRAALERAIAMPGAEVLTVPFGIALNGLGSCCYQLIDLEPAEKHYRRAVDTFIGTAEEKRLSAPLMNLGNVYRMRGDLDQAVASYAESLRYADESDLWMKSAVQSNLGSIALTREQYEEARTCYEVSLDTQRKLGDRVHEATALMNLGLVAYRQKRFSEARSLYEECTGMFDSLGDRNIGATAQVNFGIILAAMGADSEAWAAFTRALRVVRETENIEIMAAVLEGLSGLAWQRGDVSRSGRLAGAAESIRTKFDIARHPVDQREWEAEIRAHASEVGEDTFSRSWAEGQALDRDAAMALALEVAEGNGSSSRDDPRRS